MAINSRARKTLIVEGGPIDLWFGIGGKGKTRLIQKASGIYNVDFHHCDDGYLGWY